MDWNEYQELAFKTNADLGSLKLNNTHMVFGMATEAGEIIDVFKKEMAYGKEIDWKNVKEELGDLCWYIAGYAYHNDMTLTPRVELADCPTLDILMGIVTDIGMISMYRNAEDHQSHMTRLLTTLLSSVMEFCEGEEIDFYRVLENNIEKLQGKGNLQGRYDEKFTKESALKRNLEAEANILDE